MGIEPVKSKSGYQKSSWQETSRSVYQGVQEEVRISEDQIISGRDICVSGYQVEKEQQVLIFW